MSLKIGIVGLPNVGKSTLFNALTNLNVDASAYPFCTIEPNIGIVEVPDTRLDELSQVITTKRTIYPTVEFVDVAGLVAGASKGEGLGNKFLHHIREVDAIAHVIRLFTEQEVSHVHGKIDPKEDIRTIHLELILSDLDLVSRKLQEAQNRNKTKATPNDVLRQKALQKIKETLENEHLAQYCILDDDERNQLSDIPLLTNKPFFFIANVSERDIGMTNKKLQEHLEIREHVIPLCAKLEMEISTLENKQDKKDFLAEYGLIESGLDQVIKIGYATLNLVSYFTAGEKEIRAWTIPKGTKAPQAAGKIHSDFEKHFIKADVIQWHELIAYKGWSGAREKGRVRLEGKEYIVKDGDVIIFRTSA